MDPQTPIIKSRTYYWYTMWMSTVYCNLSSILVNINPDTIGIARLLLWYWTFCGSIISFLDQSSNVQEHFLHTLSSLGRHPVNSLHSKILPSSLEVLVSDLLVVEVTGGNHQDLLTPRAVVVNLYVPLKPSTNFISNISFVLYTHVHIPNIPTYK